MSMSQQDLITPQSALLQQREGLSMLQSGIDQSASMVSRRRST